MPAATSPIQAIAASDEVVQLYARDDHTSVTAFEKSPCDFERIHLEPGEMNTIRFNLKPTATSGVLRTRWP
jgi:hypothetical protein